MMWPRRQYKGIIVTGQMETELIASGPKSFCIARLGQWIQKQPLGEYDEALVLKVVKKL